MNTIYSRERSGEEEEEENEDGDEMQFQQYLALCC